MTAETFVAVLREIVEEISPQELELFDLEGEAQLTQALAGTNAQSADLGDLNSGFGPPGVETVLLYLRLIAALASTLRALGLITAKPKSKPVLTSKALGELQSRWQDELEREGIKSEVAASIANKFSNQLAEAITRAR